MMAIKTLAKLIAMGDKVFMSNFHSYLARHKLTQTAFAKRIGISQNYLSEITSGRRPSYEIAYRIEQETGGEIPMRYWAERDGVCALSHEARDINRNQGA